ncbi:carbohydrate-binding module family 20 domain-containing protein [Hamadaea tsunoensis]|uniref:carbohydrate-binding module family 20 domain-containing protein n=1 Tax=Hamadaea tsunoensis TaxID=53368 RepID=UPI0004174FF4|nr:carbohydrate-binding module family 20 domain-containing protein [Hamadaea tsunoensis]
MRAKPLRTSTSTSTSTKPNTDTVPTPTQQGRRFGRLRAIAVAAALVAAVAAVPLTRAGQPAVAAAAPHDVIANLFMWPWPSVANECTTTLGPAGYGAVQVSPPGDSISVSGHPWWEVYQPAAYDLNSRMGTAAQFASMVATCNAAGVKVYVDAVINHMTGVNQSSTTSYGGASFTNSYSYPTAGYAYADFHHPNDLCPNSDMTIKDWNNQTQVQECELLQLADLYTEKDGVRTKIANYLGGLMALGVSGFRVDAAKHINQADMAAILAKMAAAGHVPSFYAQEVWPGGSGNLAPSAFESNGGLLELNAAFALKNAFNGDIANLSAWGSGLTPSAKAATFVSNHDTERDGSTLSYKNGTTDTLANVFLLASAYGTPAVMSSFTFSSNDASPPADGNGFVSAVGCGSGWECQHRQRAIRNMVGWHNAAYGSAQANWSSPQSNVVGFSRGSNAWVALNNSGGSVTYAFTTGLADGVYCDVIHGDFSGGTCSGPTVTVSGGRATVAVAAKDAVAIDVNARVGTTTTSPTGSSSPTGSPSPSASPTATPAAAAAFNVTATTVTGQNIYVTGSIAALGSWNTANAVPLSAAAYPVWKGSVAIPAGTSFEYKYIKKDAAGNVTWESGANRAATSPVTLTDTWRDGTAQVSFSAYATTVWGQNVYVVGDIAALGGWNTGSAVALSSASYPYWTGSVSLPSGTSFQYKYIKKDGSGNVIWESGANRGATAPATLNDTWRS